MPRLDDTHRKWSVSRRKRKRARTQRAIVTTKVRTRWYSEEDIILKVISAVENFIGEN